ncbi:MAG: hypothetical protein J2P41_08560, partial [Blastocatellia bacterium]|nr:hypothetical protein [Blastocatellia bacterium]
MATGSHLTASPDLQQVVADISDFPSLGERNEKCSCSLVNTHGAPKSYGRLEFFSSVVNSRRNVRFARHSSTLTALIETPNAVAI